jgi:hypothetical protein
MLIVLIYSILTAGILIQITRKNDMAQDLIWHTIFVGILLDLISLMVLGKVHFSVVEYVGYWIGLCFGILLVRHDVKKLSKSEKQF